MNLYTVNAHDENCSADHFIEANNMESAERLFKAFAADAHDTQKWRVSVRRSGPGDTAYNCTDRYYDEGVMLCGDLISYEALTQDGVYDVSEMYEEGCNCNHCEGRAAA